MKPIVNYGLSDSLIDAVRKSVEEAKLHPNQQKLDVYEPEEDELTFRDFKKLRKLRAGKKDNIDTKPELKEEEQMDEGRSDGMSPEQKYNKHMDRAYGAANKGNWEAAANHAARAKEAATFHFKATGKKIYDPGYTGNHPHITSGQKEEYEQMDEARYDNEADARADAEKLKRKHKDGNYSVRPVGSGHEIVHAYLSDRNVNKNIEKLREEYEQMDEAKSKRKRGPYIVNAHYHPAVPGTLLGGHAGHSGYRNHERPVKKKRILVPDAFSAEHAISHVEDLFRYDPRYGGHTLIAAHLAKNQNQNEEYEQMDEVKLADLPRRNVVGTRYTGADYVDPEGADETAADMKKAEPKRKRGPQGRMQTRFDTKSYQRTHKGKLPTQY